MTSALTQVSRPWALVLATIAVFATPLGTSSTAAAALPATPGANGAELLQLVKTLYGESRKAIRSVEYDYTFELNGLVRKGRYARDGERVYSAGISVIPGGLSMPHELTWDGQRVHSRPFLSRVTRSTNRRRFKPSTPTPEDQLDTYLAQALDFQPKPSQKYRFRRGVRAEDKDHGSCIELEFAAEWLGGTLLSRHARKYGYAPVYFRLVDKDGVNVAEVTEVEFGRSESDGNQLYFPVTVTCVGATEPGQAGNKHRWQVDEATLKVNQPIAPSRFEIAPWPNEEVYDWETGKTTKAANPKWSPVGKVEFPWRDFVMLVEETRRRNLVSGSSAGATSEVPGAGARGSIPRGSLPETPWPEKLGWWLVVPGIATIAAGGYLVYRRRLRVA